MALAMGAGTRVFDIPAAHSVGLAGLVGVSSDNNGEPQCSIGLTDDLDDDLHADVLAFGLAVLIGTPEILNVSPDGILGISRQRLTQASNGPGNLAWRMLQTCGPPSTDSGWAVQVVPRAAAARLRGTRADRPAVARRPAPAHPRGI